MKTTAFEHYDAFIFDLDGTLLDSMDLWYRVDHEFLSKRGFSVDPEYTEVVKSTSIENAARYTKERFRLNESEEDIIREWNGAVRKAYREEVPLKEGAREFLLFAKSKGIKITCATALLRENAVAALENCGVLSLFDDMVTLEDMENGVDKSTPEIFLKASVRLGVSPGKALVFEDVPKALQGAAKGGLSTCAVYDRIGCGTEETWKEMEASSDLSVLSWTDIEPEF